MTVHFIGAGPGAADLITLRGRDLIAACPVCLYAGSLVPEEILSHCPEGARIVNTAPMDLDQIMAEIEAAHQAAPAHPGQDRGVPSGQSLEPRAQKRSDPLHALQEAVGQHDVEHGVGNGHGQGIATERGAMQAGLEFGNARPNSGDAQGNAPGDRLAKA